MSYASPHSRRDADRKYRRRQENAAWLESYKTRVGCYVLGPRPAHCLELHHLDPSVKKLPISKLLTRGLTGLQAELSKCIVLDRKIHRGLHGGQLTLLPRRSP